MPDNDDRLIIKARNGDKTAFGKLVKKYRQKVLYLAYDVVGDYDEAKDIAQEAFIRAYTKLGQFEKRARFSTWLYRITVNLALDIYRKKKRYPLKSLDTSLKEIESLNRENESITIKFDRAVEFDEMQVKLNAALNELTEHQKTATILKYFHQKSSKEIAVIMGCAESTARIHIHRALGNLKKMLQQKEN